MYKREHRFNCQARGCQARGRAVARGMIVLVAGWLTLSLAGNGAVAEVIVIGASGSSLKVGTVLDDRAMIELPAGERVRVMLSSGRTQEIKGPAAIKVGTLGAGEKRNESLWNDVRRLVANQKTATESSIGAVRSVAPKGNSVDKPRGSAPQFSWRRVSIDSDGDVCIEKSAPLEMLRAAPGRPMSVVVVNMQSKKRASAEFGVGSATAAWPQDVGTDVGRYTVVLADGAKREIRLRPIDPLPAADETIRLLHSQRCLQQVEAWLRGQSIAGR